MPSAAPSPQYCFPADGDELRTAVTNYFLGTTNPYGPIETWCVKDVKDFSYLFEESAITTEDLSAWDVSSATNMDYMFNKAEGYLGTGIGVWDVGSVTSMQRMFYSCKVFNEDIGSWNVANVWNMKEMLRAAWVFDQDLGSWNVDGVTDMFQMFRRTESFTGQGLDSVSFSVVSHNLSNDRRNTERTNIFACLLSTVEHR